MRRYLPILLLLPSIALLFLPYKEGVSPWAATVSHCDGSSLGMYLALLGGPFFVSIPVAIAQTRLLGKKRFPKAEKVVYRILAWAALGAGPAFFGLAFQQNGFSRSAIPWVLTLGILCAAASWIIVRSHRMLAPAESAVVTMQAAWLPNALLCGISYLDHWQIGAYLAAFTIGLYSVEIAVSMLRRTRTSAGDSVACNRARCSLSS